MSPSSLAATPFEAKLRPLPPVADLLPQSGNMVLLDRILDVSESAIAVELTVRADGLFAAPGEPVPAWVGLEYMAQAVAAYSGYQRLFLGHKIDLGFLLGTRHYQCSVPAFPCGARLTVRAEKLIESANGMAVFACAIEGAGIRGAAQLNVLLPENSEVFLAGKGL